MTEHQGHHVTMHHSVRRESLAPSNSSGPSHVALGAGRRASYLQVAAGARRMSIAAAKHAQPPSQLKLENTYKLEPDADKRFNSCKIEREMRNVLELHLKEQTYNAQECSRTCKYLTNALKDRIKDMGVERYKVVTQVTICRKSEQCFSAASRCLWDAHSDTSATASYENDSLFAVALVFGVYFD